MKRSLSLPAVLAFLAFAAGCQHTVSADQPLLADDIERTFLALDRDRNNVISRAEAQAAPRLREAFGQADANNDGVLNRYEFNTPGWRPFPGEPD